MAVRHNARNMSSAPVDIDWEMIDKFKFITYGVGAFSGVSQTAAAIWKSEGIPGFYRGYATVLFGQAPGRVLYMTSLELAKSIANKFCIKYDIPETSRAGIANFVAGASASLCTQLVAVPVDVISQRQMVHGVSTSGFAEASPAARPATASTAPTTSPTATATISAATSATTSASMQSHHQPHPGPATSSAGPSPAHHLASSASSSISSSAACSSHRSSAAPTHKFYTHVAASPAHASSSTAEALSSDAWHRHTVAAEAGPSTAVAERAAAKPLGVGHVKRVSGLYIARIILQEEGILGLYRGLGASMATFVPNSAVWWGAYGTYQKLLWSFLAASSAHGCTAGSQVAASDASSSGAQQGHASTGRVIAVQTTSSVLAGATASILTNPLDLIKTRIQVARKTEGQPVTFRGVLSDILRQEGAAGLFRGVLPRMVNSGLWGTAMVSAYEFLKRASCKPDDEL